MQHNKIAIIGARGFVGSRLVNRLSKENIPHAEFDLDTHDNKNEFIGLNIEDPASLDKLKNYHTIINLAAVHRDDIRPVTRYHDVNVKGSINICAAARRHNINKIIFISSVAIYGFAPPETDESGEPNYFNEYGRSKYLAEQVYKEWHAEDPKVRSLIIIRPTVIFGEGNRGNVFNLLNQIASNRFVMIGEGINVKSMAYVENVAAFIEFSLSFAPGLHVYNYIDKPDFNMNTLVSQTRKHLFGKHNVGFRLPSFIGMFIGHFADFISKITNIKLPLSAIRVKKFLSTTQFASSIGKTGFRSPVSLSEALERTIRYEFLEDNSNKRTFETE